MPEVKALTHVDRAAEPPRKVRVVDSTLFLAVFIVDELFQVIVLYLSLSTKILQQVFYCDIAIIILI